VKKSIDTITVFIAGVLRCLSTAIFVYW